MAKPQQAGNAPQQPLQRQGGASQAAPERRLCKRGCGRKLRPRQKDHCGPCRTALWHEKHARIGGRTVPLATPPQPGEAIRSQILGMLHDGRWYTVQEIALALNALQTTVSAKLRDLRKKRFGAFAIEHRRRQGGFAHEFRLVLGATGAA